jgi:hypothetical protein
MNRLEQNVVARLVPRRPGRQVSIRTAGIFETDTAMQGIEILNKRIAPCTFRSESHIIF